jgi:two-component system, sensor histidine kinase LadS
VSANPLYKYCTRILFIFLLGFFQINLAGQTISIAPGEAVKTLRLEDAAWLYNQSVTIPFDSIARASFGPYMEIMPDQPAHNNTWVKFNLNNQSGLGQDYILQSPKWGHLDAYIIQENGKTEHPVTGSLLPLAERSQPSNVNALRFRLEQGETKKFYLMFRSDFSIYRHAAIQLQLSQQTHFEKADSRRLLWQGAFFGIILAMALYNLFILFAVKDIGYFYYVLSIVSIGLYFAFYYGFGIEYLWPHSPVWDTFSFTVINPFTGLARILFTRTYLNTPRILPKINRILNLGIAASVITLATGLYCYITQTDLLKPLIVIIGILGAGILVMMIVAGFAAYYLNQFQPAKYFIAANILLVIGAVAFILRETGMTADNFITRYLVQYGVLIQAVVLSLGLASRLNRMRLQLATETLEKERLALEKEKEKKELIEQQRLELQQQVQEKTADLQMKNIVLEETIGKVKESETQLSQLNQVKDKLFSVVSHDLRNPLATMQSFLKLITGHQDKMNEEERKKLLSEAQQSLDNLNELLYNLLQWSRSQMNLLQFRPDKLNIKNMAETSVRLVQLHAHMKDITITNYIDEQITAYADKDMIEFILRNLLSNAIKFSHRNSEVSIRATHENQEISIEVTDNGVGMSEAKIKKLLEKHTTISRRGTEKEKGTGLGLLISKEFIEKNSGKLSIESETGKGSKFRFTIPAFV